MAKIKNESKPLRLAFVGNPNTGKTSLFNLLTGLNQKTGNYPGVTVEKKIGTFVAKETVISLIDLPGTYGLRANSRDEKIVSDLLLGKINREEKIDGIICILDVSNLKRNLYLYSQLVELNLPVLVAVTMADLLDDFSASKLAKQLGVKVIDVSAYKDSDRKKSLEELKNTAVDFFSSTPVVLKQHLKTRAKIQYKTEITKEIEAQLKKNPEISCYEVLDQLIESKPTEISLSGAKSKKNNAGHTVNLFQLTSQRYAWAEKISSAFKISLNTNHQKKTVRFDIVLTHRIWGLGIFIAVMAAIFFFIYTGAQPLMELIENGIKWAGEGASAILPESDILQSFIKDGIFGGVGSVIVFLPQIMILFFFISLLEDSGYMARAAFLMDKLLSWSGLSGRSFIPMLSSFACAIPGIMAARSIDDERTRFATILISPLMSCSARLPVYLMFIGIFIEPRFGVVIASLSLFAMHALGLIIALPLAYIFNRSIFKNKATFFTLEMPSFKRPSLQSASLRTFYAGKSFLIKAGTIIFILSIVIWFLSYFPRPQKVADHINHQYATAERELLLQKKFLSVEEFSNKWQPLQNEKQRSLSSAYLEQSFLGSFGKTVQPLFAPLGFDWKLTVGILSAFPAREVIISTLGIIYNSEESDDNTMLKERILAQKNPDGSPAYTALTALSLLIFIALCAQCMSTLATVRKELNSTKWALFQFGYMTTLAYLASLLVYQTGRFFIS